MFLRVAVWAAVLPFLMNTAGWFLTESGRQPWIVQGIMLTKNGISPTVSTTTLWISLIAFVVLYGTLGHRRPAADAAVLPRAAPAPAHRGRRGRAGAGRPVLGVVMGLIPFWYIIIAILWTGFFILEGFDFGVGMLHNAVGGDEAGRRAAINTIGPLWDGNEVWLIVAGAGMFAAFPGWYATMFSAYNLALVLLLAALIVRGVAFEYRGKRDAARWRRTWDAALTVGSVLAPLLIGVALAGLLHGLPINSAQDYTGSFWDLLQPYALFTGITLVLICVLHGATFLCLKTTGDMHQRSWQLARRVAPFTAAFVIGFVIWTHVTASTAFFLNLDRAARRPGRARRRLAGLRPPRRLRLRRHRRHHRVLHHRDLRRPVPQRDGLLHQPRLQPHRAQHSVRRVLPQGDDRGRDHPPAGGPRLPDLDLLRVPAPRQPVRFPARRPSRPPDPSESRYNSPPLPSPLRAVRMAEPHHPARMNRWPVYLSATITRRGDGDREPNAI